MTHVTVPFGKDPATTATLLLAAAEETVQDQSVVRTTEGAFMVPKEVADQAGVDYESDDEPKAPAKKAAKKK